MKKLKLNLDQLKVNSFEIKKSSKETGTIVGNVADTKQNCLPTELTGFCCPLETAIYCYTVECT
ncbi:MAG: pinensin family lanthipeptide [Rhodothermaceae bacterium]